MEFNAIEQAIRRANAIAAAVKHAASLSDHLVSSKGREIRRLQRIVDPSDHALAQLESPLGAKQCWFHVRFGSGADNTK